MSWALITGASGGIGHASAHALAKKGWSLYLHYNHQEEAASRLQKELSAAYPKQDFLTLQADLQQEGEVHDLASSLFALDAIVFAAGIADFHLVSDVTSAQLEALWHIHVQAPILLLHDLQHKLAQSSLGRVIFVGSVYGARGAAMETVYSAVKGAQSAFVRAYAQEVAGLGITVNVVAPGAVDTPMNAVLDDAERAALIEEIPLGRLADPSEIGDIIANFIAEMPDYITGQTIYATGGWRH